MKKLALAISVALISGNVMAAADATIDDASAVHKDNLKAGINALYAADIVAKQNNPEDNLSLIKATGSSNNQVSSTQRSYALDSHLSAIELKNSNGNTVSVDQTGSDNASLAKLKNTSSSTVAVSQSASDNESFLKLKNSEFSDVSVTQSADNNFAGLDLNGADGASGSRNSITVEQNVNNQAYIEVNGTNSSGGFTASGNTILVQQVGDSAIAELDLVEVNNDTITVTQMDNDQAYLDMYDAWGNTVTVDQEGDNTAFVTVTMSDGNTVLVDQNGSFNTSTVNIDSSLRAYAGGNKVTLTQEGDNNTANATVISGRRNVVDVTQTGDDNLSDTWIEFGNDNNVMVNQDRDHNIANISVSYGSSNDITLSQNHNSQALITLTGSSNNNVAGLPGQTVDGIQVVQGYNEMAIVTMANSNGNAVYINQE